MNLAAEDSSLSSINVIYRPKVDLHCGLSFRDSVLQHQPRILFYLAAFELQHPQLDGLPFFVGRLEAFSQINPALNTDLELAGEVHLLQVRQHMAEMFHTLRVYVLDASRCWRSGLVEHVDGEMSDAGLAADHGLVGDAVLEKLPTLRCYLVLE